MLRVSSCIAGLMVWGLAGLMPFAVPQARGSSVGEIYGVGVDNRIYFIDPVAESITFVATSLSTGVKANGFATDRVRDQLFYFGSNGDLFYYDVPSNTGGTVASAAAFGIDDGFPPEDAAFYDGSFWYIGKGDAANDILYRAGLTYAGGVPSFGGTPLEYQLTVGGSTSGMMFGDIAVNDTTGTLYGSTTPGSGGLFFSLDMATLAAGTTNPVTVISVSNTVGLQLAFSQDYSVLFGQHYTFDPLDPTNPALTAGEWYTVDTIAGTYAAIPGFVTTPGMRDLAGTAAPEPATCLLATVGATAMIALRRRVTGRRRSR
jgi:hypothetical protein